MVLYYAAVAVEADEVGDVVVPALDNCELQSQAHVVHSGRTNHLLEYAPRAVVECNTWNRNDILKVAEVEYHPDVFGEGCASCLLDVCHSESWTVNNPV